MQSARVFLHVSVGDHSGDTHKSGDDDGKDSNFGFVNTVSAFGEVLFSQSRITDKRC